MWFFNPINFEKTYNQGNWFIVIQAKIYGGNDLERLIPNRLANCNGNSPNLLEISVNLEINLIPRNFSLISYFYSA